MGHNGRGWVRGRCLGRGSTAAVYLADSTSGEQEAFAVKSAELSRSAPLRRERTILSSLCSPHIVSCFGSDVTTDPDGRVLYDLFIEYVSGGDLSEIIKQHGGLRERAIRSYTRGILKGLAYLHCRGIVHCDVKSKNILLGKDDGSIKLADFGCARCVDGGDDRVVISGTPLYMAPEVARGEEQGPAADIWALGCTVVEMATGCPPWRDVADPVAALHRIAFSSEVPEFPGSISDEACDFLDRCLNRDPRQRWCAEDLLNHPFVSCTEDFAAGCIPDSKRVSPKSTLDLVFWDSWQEENEVEEEAGPHMGSQSAEAAQECLRQMLGGVVSPPLVVNATWEDGGWITVRNGEHCGSENEPSSSGSWFMEFVDDGTGGEELAGNSACNVVTRETHLPAGPTHHVLVTVVNTSASPSSLFVDEGDDHVETPRPSNHFTPHRTFSSDFSYNGGDDVLLLR